MATMPSAKVLREDIELRSTWKVKIHRIELKGEILEIPTLERRVVGGRHRGKKVAVGTVPGHYFKGGADYEAALLRLLADAEVAIADLLEGGDNEADGGNAHTAA